MSLEERLANIGQNILFVIGVLGFVFILVGMHSTNINWLFIGIGIVLLFPFLVFMFWLKNSSEKITKKQEKKFQKFLKTADRVHVTLDDAKIKEKKHTETNTVQQDYKALAINEVSGNGHYNEERVTYTYCEVTFNVKYKGKKRIIEEVISKDKTSVRMHFYMQKVTTLYINPYDTDEIYLDLTFIEN